MTSPLRLIAIDIDGTLLPSSGIAISARNCRALQLAAEAGIEIAIATGRRHHYAAPILLQAELSPETMLISSNGSVTRTLGGERIDHRALDADTARALCPALRRFGGTTVFTFDQEGPGELVVESLEQLRARVPAWVEANRDFLREVRPLEQAFDPGDGRMHGPNQGPIQGPIQGMICGSVPAMREAELWLAGSPHAEQVELQRTEYPARDLSILDLLPPGCSKGTALRRLAESRGWGAAEVMAIGDNWNDLKMLEWAGHPVVMGNGAPDLVQLAAGRGWRIAPGNDEDGVAQTIEALLAERFPGPDRPSLKPIGMVECP